MQTKSKLAAALAAILSVAGAAHADDAKSVVFIPGFAGNSFYNTVGYGIEQEAKALGWTYASQGSTTSFSAAAQTPFVNAVCGGSPTVLVIAPTDAAAMRGPIKKCMDLGVKVVIVDTSLNDPSGAVTSISSDNYQGGQLAADYIAEKLGGKGTVAIQSGSPNIVTQAARAKGAIDQFEAKYPDIKLLEIAYFTSEAAAQTGTTATITGSPELAAVFNTTSACIGPANAIGQSHTAKPLLVCYDSSETSNKLLKSGKVGALVVQDAENEGRLAVQAARDALDGKAAPASSLLTPVIITSEKANDPEMQKYYYKE